MISVFTPFKLFHRSALREAKRQQPMDRLPVAASPHRFIHNVSFNLYQSSLLREAKRFQPIGRLSDTATTHKLICC